MDPQADRAAAGTISGCSTSLWSVEEHPLGRGAVLASNVERHGEMVRLLARRGSHEGAEIASATAFASGSFAARMRCDVPAGAICAFFMYEPAAAGADEIDIEIIPSRREIHLVTWVRGERTNAAVYPLPARFDPAETHVYSIEHRPDRTTFFVDDEAVAAFTENLPTRQMKLLVNVWWPTWLEPSGRGGGGRVELDWIRWNTPDGTGFSEADAGTGTS